MSQWRSGKAPDAAWRCPAGLGKAARSAEQDLAAGGRARRRVNCSATGALGSVALRRKADGRRVYAYLRWSEGGKTSECYVGQVQASTRAENLAGAWCLAAKLGLAGGLPDSLAHSAALETRPQEAVSWAATPGVRAIMQGNKGRDTRPELAVRSAVHALGLRYRVGVRPLARVRRTADLVFPRQKVAVFVDGCFWHGCSSHHRPATRNSEFWSAKIEGNIARDADTDRQLTDAGWRVIRVWEHEDPAAAAGSIRSAVRGEVSAELQTGLVPSRSAHR
jgi:DNA mismatch endonuclease (patch repair protein)